MNPLRLLPMALALVLPFAEHTSSASTSLALSLDSLVDHAAGVALVEPIEATSRWEDGHIVTYTHIRTIERVAGTIPGDAWVRTYGGTVGDLSQWVEGEADLRSRSLVFLRSESTGTLVVVGRAQGQYLATSENGAMVLRSGPLPGHLVSPRGVSTRPYPLAGRSFHDASQAVRDLWQVRHVAR
jgi:hypothetical protein